MTRAAKIRGGVVAGLMVCLLLPLLARPQLVHAFLHRLRGFHANLADAPRNPQMAALPSLFFWAWERPEDLRFLQSKSAGVAFLAKTIYVSTPDKNSRHVAASDALLVRPRLQPLRVAPDTPLIAVVRIETRAGQQSEFTPQQNQRLVDEIIDLRNLSNIRAIQIDFDATDSERASYATLLKDLRDKLPASLPLSITALTSWCIGDPWIEQLPPGTIDEAVPMLFRMGPDTGEVAQFLHTSNEFRTAACQGSLGVSTDEPLSDRLLKRTLPGVPSDWHNKRIYVFAPRAWTQPAAEAVLKEWQP